MEQREQEPLFIGPVYGWQNAAEELGCSITWIRELVRLGKAAPSVPVGRNGRRYMFSQGDLERLARAAGRPLREEEPTSHAA